LPQNGPVMKKRTEMSPHPEKATKGFPAVAIMSKKQKRPPPGEKTKTAGKRGEKALRGGKGEAQKGDVVTGRWVQTRNKYEKKKNGGRRAVQKKPNDAGKKRDGSCGGDEERIQLQKEGLFKATVGFYLHRSEKGVECKKSHKKKNSKDEKKNGKDNALGGPERKKIM